MVAAGVLLLEVVISLGFDSKTFYNASLNGTVGRGLDNFLLFDQDISPVLSASAQIVKPGRRRRNADRYCQNAYQRRKDG
jgi:hypothetical protein